MLKSPTSILNSIQRMKTNLRNDKEQLRIIKTNFVYLDQSQSRPRQIDHEIRVKNRSRSVLNCQKVGEYQREQSLNNKENDNSRSNSGVREFDIKEISNNQDYQKQHNDNTIKTNKIYLPNQLKQQNILTNNNSNFKKDSYSRVSHHQDNQEKLKQSAHLKQIKQKHQMEIEKLRKDHETEKNEMMEKLIVEIREQKDMYDGQIQEMRDYIHLLEGQVNEISLKNDMVNTSCQMTQKIDFNQLNLPKPTTQQSVQTSEPSINHFSSIQSNNYLTSSKINTQNSPNLKINGINVHQNNLIEQLCFKYFSNQNSDSIPKQTESFDLGQRQKYEYIINKLLEENTKMYKRIEKIYGQAHSENATQQMKNSFFKSFGINYRTVSSHQPNDDSNEHSSVTERSRVINKYPFSKESNSNAGLSESEFASRVTESNNYHTHRDASNQNKGKQSIIYRISNVMSASLIKDGKNSSRSKMPCKNPPIKVKQGINVSMPQQQRRLKTQVSQKSSQFFSQNFNSNPTSGFDMMSRQSKQIGSEERIPTMREKMKNQPSFKFYDDDSQVSEKVKFKATKNKIQNWQHESQNEIKDDEIKLKTIKNFKCLQNQ